MQPKLKPSVLVLLDCHWTYPGSATEQIAMQQHHRAKINHKLRKVLIQSSNNYHQLTKIIDIAITIYAKIMSKIKSISHEHSFPFYLFNTSLEKDDGPRYEFHKNRMPKHIIITIITTTTIMVMMMTAGRNTLLTSLV